MERHHNFERQGEASEEGTIATDVVDGFERKSFELLEYINRLEAKLEQQYNEFKNMESQVEGETRSLQEKMENALQHAKLENDRLQQDHARALRESEQTIQSLTKHLHATHSCFRKHRRRVQDLEKKASQLKQQITQNEQLHSYQKSRDEKEKCRLQEQVKMLRIKFSLGCTLARLSEVYLRMEQVGTGDHKTPPIDKVDQHIQKQILCLIESAVASSTANDEELENPSAAATVTAIHEGSSSDGTEGSEWDFDARINEFEKNSGEDIGSMRRAGSVRPILSRDSRKQQTLSNADRVECEHHQRNSAIEIRSERETETEMHITSSRRDHHHEYVKCTKTGAHANIIRWRAEAPTPSARPPSSAQTFRPPSPSPKKDKDGEVANSGGEKTEKLDISRPQREIHKFISNMKSTTKITSSALTED